MAMKNPRPNWWLLYGTLLLAVGLFAVVAYTNPSAGWRQLVEGLIVLAIFGALALWLRANRVALALYDRTPRAADSVHAWVAYSPQAPARPRREIPANESKRRLAA